MAADLLTHGSDRRGRFATALHRLRRGPAAHAGGRRGRATVVVGLLLAVAGAVYLGTRPPPVDPVVQVRFVGTVILPDSPQTFPDEAGGDELLVRATYTMHTDVVGDSVQLLGIAGPGLRPLEASPVQATAGHDASVHLTAAVDCSQPGWWSATDDDYRMRVLRTDSRGRSVDYLAPFGATAQSWRTEVRQLCVQRSVRQLTVSAATADARPGHPLTHITFTLRSALPYRIWVQPLGGTDLEPPMQVVEPGASVDLKMYWLVMECGTRSRSGPWVESNEGTPPYLRIRLDTAPLDTSPVATEDSADRQVAGVFLEPSLTRGLLGALHEVCRGIPAVDATVVSVQPVAVTGPAGSWRLGIRLRVNADRLAFGIQHLTSPPNPSVGDESSVELPRAARLQDGVTRVTAGWSIYSCNQDDVSPPSMYVVAIAGERRYPLRVTLDDANLLAAVRGVCPGYPGTSDPSAAGW